MDFLNNLRQQFLEASQRSPHRGIMMILVAALGYAISGDDKTLRRYVIIVGLLGLVVFGTRILWYFDQKWLEPKRLPFKAWEESLEPMEKAMGVLSSFSPDIASTSSVDYVEDHLTAVRDAMNQAGVTTHPIVVSDDGCRRDWERQLLRLINFRRLGREGLRIAQEKWPVSKAGSQ